MATWSYQNRATHILIPSATRARKSSSFSVEHGVGKIVLMTTFHHNVHPAAVPMYTHIGHKQDPEVQHSLCLPFGCVLC
jgi:hypothetical protein